jgi:hypothetical protein
MVIQVPFPFHLSIFAAGNAWAFQAIIGVQQDINEFTYSVGTKQGRGK